MPHWSLDGTLLFAARAKIFFAKATIFLSPRSQPLLAIGESSLHRHLQEIPQQEMQAIRANAPREHQAFAESTTTLAVNANSTTTTDSSPADRNLAYYKPKPKDISKAKRRGRGRSKAKRRSRHKANPPFGWTMIFEGDVLKRHFSDIPVPKAAKDRLTEWMDNYQDRLGDFLEDYKGLARGKVDNERLEYWGSCKEDAKLNLVFRWAKGLKKPLLRFLKRKPVSHQTKGFFLVYGGDLGLVFAYLNRLFGLWFFFLVSFLTSESI